MVNPDDGLRYPASPLGHGEEQYASARVLSVIIQHLAPVQVGIDLGPTLRNTSELIFCATTRATRIPPWIVKAQVGVASSESRGAHSLQSRLARPA